MTGKAYKDLLGTTELYLHSGCHRGGDDRLDATQQQQLSGLDGRLERALGL